MAKRMEGHHPYGHEVHTTDELNDHDHLCPSSKRVAPLPDSMRETWMEEDLYSKQPTNGIPNHGHGHRE